MGEYARLAEAAAKEHSLPDWLVKSIISVESGGNPYASRYEHEFYINYIVGLGKIYVSPPCSLQTERILRATSLGLMQIMGQVARERGFKGTYLTELCIADVGIEYGCRQLSYLVKKFGPNIDDVIRAYNGGNPKANNIDYLRRVHAERENI